MHHTQPPDTILSDKACSAHPLAGSSSVASVFVADLSLLDSFDCFTITNDSHGDLRFQSCDFTSQYLCNQQFSITAVTTSTGSVAERYAYTAYGQPTFLDASGTPLTTQTSTLNARYLYTGREWDATLGLYHFRARWLSGMAGRFLGRDPIGYFDSRNLFEYVSGQCLINIDPEGFGKAFTIKNTTGHIPCGGFTTTIEYKAGQLLNLPAGKYIVVQKICLPSGQVSDCEPLGCHCMEKFPASICNACCYLEVIGGGEAPRDKIMSARDNYTMPAYSESGCK